MIPFARGPLVGLTALAAFLAALLLAAPAWAQRCVDRESGVKILRGHGEQPVGMGKTFLRGQPVIVEFWKSDYSNNTWTVVLVIPAGGDDLMMCTVSSGRDWRATAVIE